MAAIPTPKPVGDMLIVLYCLSPRLLAPPVDVNVRKPIGSEHDLIVRWIATQFSAGCVSETGRSGS